MPQIVIFGNHLRVMAKKNNKTKPVQNVNPVQATVAEKPVAASTPKSFSLYDFKTQAIIVGLLAFVFYFNSFFNETAHDDGIVIVKNEYVQEGFAGIPKIFTRDAYDSYYRQLNTTNQLSGGRYRPLSIVTFAIEQQFLGPISEDRVDSVLKENIAYGVKGAQAQRLVSQMHVRHVINVLWYIASVVILLYFLRKIVFKNAPIVAFLAAVIFTIHPIHTEVVANVKSRDEIMSLLFICTTFIFDFKYRETKKTWMLIAAMVSYALAFLSKEYCITLIFLLPLAHYIFNKYTLSKSIIAFMPYVVVIGLYWLLRHSIVAPPGENADTEVLNNPYVYASATEKLATEIATSLNYLKLLIWPHPLSADYSYDSIPYKDFGNIWVWLSLIIHGGLVAAMIILFKKRSVLCFAIAFYLLHLALVCNIFFDIGATMGERLIYHSSVGFAIALAYFLYKGAEKIKPVAVGQRALAGFMVVIIVLAGIKTIARNADWKNDNTLFQADIKTVPNSVLVCANVAASYITIADEKDEKGRKEYLYKAIGLLDHALSIHPNMVASYMNRGIAYYKLGEMDRAKANLDSVKKRYPTYPTLPGIYKLIGDDYNRKGWEAYGKVGKFPEAINEFRKGITIDSANADLWYNLGGAYYSNRQYPEAIEAWKMTLRIRPDYGKARMGLQAAMGAMGMVPQAPPAKKQ
jgi:protein O-mannosyl-transferase